MRSVADSRQHAAGVTFGSAGEIAGSSRGSVAGAYYPENAIVGPGRVSALQPGESRSARARSTSPWWSIITPAGSCGQRSQTGWLSGAQTVSVNAAEAQPLSGIEGVSCSLDGAPATWTAGNQASVTATANGTHLIQCKALTNAQTWGQGRQLCYSMPVPPLLPAV